MNTGDDTSGRRRLQISIARAEIALGLLVFVYATLSPMLGRLLPALEPDALYGLWPLILMFGGLWLVVAGGGVLRYERWSFLMHVPLLIWIIFVGYVFFQMTPEVY
jgi:hypothetical protein